MTDYERYRTALADLDPPFAFVDLDAFWANAAGLELAAIMGYEAQIAGVGDDPPSRLRGAAIRWMQRRSGAELVERRAAVVGAVRGVTGRDLIVNGGGTGSVERTSAEDVVTEVT